MNLHIKRPRKIVRGSRIKNNSQSQISKITDEKDEIMSFALIYIY